MNIKLFSFLFLSNLLLLSACQQGEVDLHQLMGNAQGTTFKVSYTGQEVPSIKKDIDSIFFAIDKACSLWMEEAIINAINDSDTSFSLGESNEIFCDLLSISDKLHLTTDGAFDPSIYPLVKAYGFGEGEPSLNQGIELDSIKSLVDWNAVSHSCNPLNIQKNKGVMLDFNAMAQGYTVDKISKLLIDEEVANFMVEVGGEIYAQGLNQKGNKWVIGIEKPEKNRREDFQTVVGIDSRAIATSGSYRKFYEKDGKKYSHIINPKSGLPVEHSLLSATIVANTAAEADAWATACMVMGLEEAKHQISQNRLEGYFIFSVGDSLDSFTTPGFEQLEYKD